MKRLICLLLVIASMLFLCACQGNFGSVNLKDPIEIPEDGVVDKNTIKQIQNENAIAIFVGTSGDLKYEWTVFCSEIREAKAVNLGLQLSKSQEENICVTLNQTEAFGFSASLAIYLNEQWAAQTATACAGETIVAAVSVTGSKNTILNLNLDGSTRQFVISPDLLPTEETVAVTKPEEMTKPAASQETAKPTEPTETTKSVEQEEPVKPAETSQPTESVKTTTPTEKEKPTASTEIMKPTKPEETTKPAETSQPTESAKPTNPTKPEDTSPSATKTTNPTETKKQDKYHTDPIPEGKPQPVEPEDQDVNKGKTYTCTFSIECSAILNNLDQLDPAKLEMVPSDGVILPKTEVIFYEGESVFDVLQRVCKENGIHLEASWTPMYNSAYIEGIHNLYEFDCGALSGWMYRVNGWYPNYGCSRYQLNDSEVVEWRFTCDMGNDIGGGYAVGG